MKRRLILLLMISQMAFLCEERWEKAIDDNRPPEISFRLIEMPGASLKTEGEERYFQTVSDSMKLSLKATQKYELVLDLGDDDLERLGYRNLEGNGTIRQENIEDLPDGVLLLNGSRQIRVDYFPEAVGDHILEFYAEDAFRARTEIRLELSVFENLPPVGGIELYFKGTLNAGHYVLDAGSSYDMDSRWGGYIARYRYFVDGEKVGYAPHPFLEHIFQAPGRYEVAVEVTDNEGVKSSTTILTDIQF